jgi:HAMP domain-containing protein
VRHASLQARVAAAAAAAIVVAVAALGIAVLARLDNSLYDALDRSLRSRATEVARLAASTPDLLLEPGTLEGRLGGSSLLVEVIDRRGRIVARSSGLGSRVLPEGPAVRAALEDRRAGYRDALLGTEPVRLYAAPLGELGRGPAAGGAVIVAGTTAEIEDTLDSTRRFVVLAAIAAALLAAALATGLAGRALRPLRRLSSGAREIERTGDVSQRLPVPPIIPPTERPPSRDQEGTRPGGTSVAYGFGTPVPAEQTGGRSRRLLRRRLGQQPSASPCHAFEYPAGKLHLRRAPYVSLLEGPGVDRVSVAHQLKHAWFAELLG